MDAQEINSLQKALVDFEVNHPDIKKHNKIAVAVSGGPDSMALSLAVVHVYREKELCFLTVDHGLRAESKEEAAMVAQWVDSLNSDYVTHRTLKWAGEKPDNAIQETARHERYKLMADYCAEQKISLLFLGHHADDQIETFFMRLSKGSGLDGLSSMAEVRNYNDDLKLMRPFLSISKEELLNYCNENNVPYVNDPTNNKEEFLRPRLRQSMDILRAEGLGTKRVKTLIRRLNRAKEGLEQITSEYKIKLYKKIDNRTQSIDWQGFLSAPEEISFRLLGDSIEEFRPNETYHVRMEKLEDLFEALLIEKENFKPRTLGGSLIKLSKNKDVLIIQKEK